jgi:GAF domain-containing protein
LLLVDARRRVLRGHLAAQPSPADEEDSDAASFEILARRVVECTERIDTSDLTLKLRGFSVPLDWRACGAAKAAATGAPVLADRRLGEFAGDPVFDYFGSTGYVAIPLRLRGVVHAVLLADNGEAERPIGAEDISLVYSMSQLAATAMDRLYQAADNARKFRVLRKLQDALSSVEDTRRFGDALSTILSMVARAIGGTGALLKDPLRKKVTHVKSVDDVDSSDRDADIAITDCFDDVMDRAAVSHKPVRGDSGHPMLNEAAARAVRHFLALPLLAGGECLGAIVVYAEGGGAGEFSSRDRSFFELCAGMIAERLDSLYKAEQVRRTQRMFDEVQSNWMRERESVRAGQRVAEHHDAVVSQLDEVSLALAGSGGPDSRVASARALLERLQSEADAFRAELEAEQRSLELVDLFDLVRSATTDWVVPVRAAGVEVTARVPERGPVLLMNRTSVVTALDAILGALAANVSRGDRALVECSATADKAVVLVADTAERADGGLWSRLFMPQTGAHDPSDLRAALSVAGDIIQKHSGAITVRSSPSWKTILVISFPAAGNSDRRGRRDRRRRARDRRR